MSMLPGITALRLFVALAVPFSVFLLGMPAAAKAEMQAPYSGQKISLDLQQAEIGDVLRLIAEVSGLNIIAGPEVRGTVTARLVDVPWDQALAVLLKLHSLTQERYGNVILIAPMQRVISQRQALLHAQQAAQQAEPTVTHVVPIKYRDATALKAVLEQHLGTCAVVSVDARTNTLLITGTPSCLRSDGKPAP
jgi:type IV pilus assembly protein PilQ